MSSLILINTAANAARDGLSVTYVTEAHRIRFALDDLVQTITTGETSRITRTVGREELALRNGGRIRLVSDIGQRLTTSEVLIIARAGH